MGNSSSGAGKGIFRSLFSASNINELLSNLDGAIAHRSQIKEQHYQYYVTVEDKQRTHFLGFRGEPKYVYHQELRTNTALYNRDVSRADQNIQYYRDRIERLINSAKVQLSNLQSEASAASSQIPVLQQKLQHLSGQYQSKCSTIQTLQQQTQSKITEAALATQKINEESAMVASLSGQIATMHQSILSHEGVLVQTEEKLRQAEEQLTEEEVNLKLQLEGLSSEQRAYLFAQLYSNLEKGFMLEIIKEIGFEAGVLGFYAIEKGNLELVKIALCMGVDFGSYSYDGKTLIQHLIASENQELMDFILSIGSQDFATTLTVALGQNDCNTTQSLLSHNRYLLNDLNQAGYSLLQAAIAVGKPEIVKLIIGLDETTLDILNTNGESAFCIALRQNIPEILEILLLHINIEQEVALLSERGDTELLQNLLGYEHSLLESEVEAINKILLGKEAEPVLEYQIDLLAELDNYDM